MEFKMLKTKTVEFNIVESKDYSIKGYIIESKFVESKDHLLQRWLNTKVVEFKFLECDLKLKFQRKKVSDKEEIYTLKDKSCQENFKDYTNNAHMAKIFER